MNRIYSQTLFKNKVNVVTGGGTGIGYGVAKGLVQLGSKVVIASRKVETINDAVKNLRPFCTDDADISGITCDIRDRDSVADMIKTTLDRHGRLDGLCNNGGGQFHSKG